MAELVAGAFLSSFFQVIFEKLASSNFTEYFHRGKLDKLVEELESTLDSINQVLDDAEIKQYQIPNVKKWLGDVKHAMYEADQLLDEIATDAPMKKLKAESQPSTSHNIVNFIPTFTNPFESRIKDLIKSLHSLVEQKDKLQLINQTHAGNAVGFNSKPSGIKETTCSVDASGIYGRDAEKEEMIKTLLSSENGSSNQTPIISIVGLGGMGKTTFAKLVYNDNMIKEHFELKAWVYVSESFDVVGLTKEILKTFNSSAEGESNLNLLQQRLEKTLTGKKYLLVLDDIWNGNEESWEQLLLPFNHRSSGSKIIVTTRDKEITYILKSTKLFYLQQLNKINCWSLFVTHAFHGENLDEYPHLKRIGMKIVDKCGGLPLGVKTLGKLLRKKFSEHEWRKILETDMWQLSDEENNINPVLRLSYHNLPSNRKRCFAYCSLFPKGYCFDKGGLIKFWMAEGLLKCCGADKSEEELGNEIFNDLESISFFQKPWYSNFVMHDLVNDLAKSVSGEFCMQIEGSRVEGIPERTRHIWLSHQIIKCGDKLPGPIFERKGLRSLILEKDRMAPLISNNVQRDLFSRLICLRMLSFTGYGLSELVDEIGNLKLLRYLDLSYTKIKSLPDTICMLYNLQTLLLEGCCELTELPSNFSKLINLRHLELPFDGSGRPCIKKLPKNIGKLNKLQSFPFIIVEEQNEYVLKELEKLNHLHGRIDIEGLGNVIDPADAAMANLKDKKYLEELKMDFYKNEREEMNESIVERHVSVLEALQPNSNLKRLTIVNYNGNSYPNWLRGCDLPNLVSLKLENCGLCSHLPPLGQFPLLKELCIKKCPELKSVPPQHLSSLQKLKMSECNKLEECLCLEGSPLLEYVSIKKCSKLKRAPLPQHLPSLQKLKIRDCERLEISIPKGDSIIELYLEKCDRILVNGLSAGLERFVLSENCYYTWFSVEDFSTSLDLSISLDLGEGELEISGCDSSSSLPFSLHLFTNLQYLRLLNCPQLESFPRGGLPSNLNYLTIENCPKLIASREVWGMPSNLSWLTIRNCPKLIGSRGEWGLFQLNSLQILQIRDHEFENVESFPEENLLPPTLQELELENCSKLRRMNNKGFLHLNSLKSLSIYNCPSLERLPEEGLQQLSSLYWLPEEGVPPQHLHSLQKLQIVDCKMLEASIPKGDNIKELELRRCDRVLVNGLSTGLKKFFLWENRYTEFSEEQALVNCTVLEELEFDLRGFVEKRPSLDLRCYNSLRKLSIIGWDSSSFPFSLHLFTNLHYLYLCDCPQLESFPRGGLPSNLIELRIENCPKLIGSRGEWGLFQLNSLQILQIRDHEFENVESFPEENLLPPTLERLYLINCSKLRIMNNKGFLHLISLIWLSIYKCPSLESLPEEGLQQLSSLYSLGIRECPLIREKYKKEGGERWHTISHIPCVII